MGLIPIKLNVYPLFKVENPLYSRLILDSLCGLLMFVETGKYYQRLNEPRNNIRYYHHLPNTRIAGYGAGGSKEMKKYIVFQFDLYYPVGGLNDMRESFDTLEEAEKFCLEDRWDFNHIVDRDTWEIVWHT